MSVSSREMMVLKAVQAMPKGYPLGLNSAMCRRLARSGHLRTKEVFNAPGKSTLHFFLTPKGIRELTSESKPND